MAIHNRIIPGFMIYCAALACARAQTSQITAFENGRVVWTNSTTNALYTVQWASQLTNQWHDDWSTLRDMPVSSTTMTSSVPMFYRIVGYAPPPYVNGLWSIVHDYTNDTAYGPHIVTNIVLFSQRGRDLTGSLWITDLDLPWLLLGSINTSNITLSTCPPVYTWYTGVVSAAGTTIDGLFNGSNTIGEVWSGTWTGTHTYTF